MNRAAVLVLLGKPSCHLCEEMREVVTGVLPRWHAVLEERDVREDPAVSGLWGYEIPVLFLGGVELARHRVETVELEELLARNGVSRRRQALTFADHGRDLDQNRYVYAVVSRRARGLSIGVNLNPDKVCNFDCPYCQVDRKIPGGPPGVDVSVIGAELFALLDRARCGTLWSHPLFATTPPLLRRVVDVAFAGDGEPTTPREFPAASRAAREVLDRSGLEVPLRLLTNATMLDRPRVRAALPIFDELWCKLDAGTETYFHQVDGTRLPFRRILENLLGVARERPIVIQSMFPSLEGAAPPEAEIEAYAGRLREILDRGGRIDLVQVYTVARRPADARVGAVSEARLEQIAERVRAEGLRTEVYGAA